MDPTALLRKIRNLIASMVAGGAETQLDYVEDLMSDMRDLDSWLSRGGFLPADWAAGRINAHADRAQIAITLCAIDGGNAGGAYLHGAQARQWWNTLPMGERDRYRRRAQMILDIVATLSTVPGGTRDLAPDACPFTFVHTRHFCNNPDCPELV
jgi:hypothetical protein